MVTEFEREELLSKIQQMLIDCESDKAIMSQLELASSTYYNYKRQLQDDSITKLKEQRVSDYSNSIDELLSRLKTIYRHILQRIGDSHRTSNRELSNLAGLSVDIAYKILDVEKTRHEIIFNKQKLPEVATPALIEEPESDEEDNGMDWDPESNEYVHSRSTDSNPIV